ncbi:hypothetical protein [uncultured Reyranella sp.]|uniref:YunG family protein n=1 Tax=uncultured Reyranella sp. TaxID=735512 RepID=UPI0025FE77F5|nr:hypothetical protein [uncultured Reyranella sp.]
MHLTSALLAKLHSAWSTETGSKWRSDNPACGQCSVTALVAQDLLGGDILKTIVEGQWHFYNRVGGRRLDLTESQFSQPLDYQDLPCNRSEALEDTSLVQYRILKSRVAP